MADPTDINWIDGFEMYNGTTAGLGALTRWGGTFTIVSENARSGAKCMYLANLGGSNATRPVPASTIQGFQFSRRCDTAGSRNIFEFYQGSTLHFALRENSDGSASVLRGTTVLATSNLGKIIVGTHNFFEIENFVCSDTAGGVVIKINSETVIALSGVDTLNGGTGVISSIRFPGGIIWIDDCVSTKGPTFGEQGILPLYPNSDVSTDWSPISGSTNYEMVDELVPDGDVSFVEGATIGDADLYSFTSLPNGITAVTAANLICYPRKTDIGAKAMRLNVAHGATSTALSNINLTDNYMRVDHLLTAAPDGGGLSAAKVNSFKAGPEVTS